MGKGLMAEEVGLSTHKSIVTIFQLYKGYIAYLSPIWILLMAYHISKLVKLSSKGGKYYVQVTKPLELQSKSSKQIKRSTGTTDLKEAQRRQHGITESIYQEFEKSLKSNRERAFQAALRKGIERLPPGPHKIPVDVSARVTLDSMERKRQSTTPTLAEAVSAYTTFKTWGRNKTKREVEANIQKIY